MCPACIASAAWLIAGTASAGGLTAFALQHTRRKGHHEELRPTAKTNDARVAQLSEEVQP